MAEPDLTAAIEVVKRFAARELGATLESGDVEEKLRELLFGPREFWGQYEHRLITSTETATVVLAHINSWLIGRSGRSWADEPSDRDWDGLIAEMERALFPLN